MIKLYSIFSPYFFGLTKKSFIKSKDIKKISTNNIKKMLENSLQNEDYEMAAKLRDELNSRKSIK